MNLESSDETLTSEDQQAIDQALRGCRIFSLALSVGLIVFMAIVLWLKRGQTPEVLPRSVVWVFIGQSALALMMSFVLSSPAGLLARLRAAAQGQPSSSPSSTGVGNQSRFSKDQPLLAGPILDAFRSSVIIKGAISEGAGMAAAASYLIRPSLVGLALAGVALLAILWRVPNRAGLTDWLLGQRDRIRQEA